MFPFGNKTEMVAPQDALPGRPEPLPLTNRHAVFGTPLKGPFPDGLEVAEFGMGCFWGAERSFWGLPGIYTTAAGYSGGYTPNPTYEETCTNKSGHAETVLVVFDPQELSYEDLLKSFWEAHDPTQYMAQGNDVGTTYRSAVYTHSDAQLAAAEASRALYQEKLTAAGHGEITTEIKPAGDFFYAEDPHQQYLHKVPNGYCSMSGTGVSCPIGLAAA
ncbi:MAG: peptide-methionine (S)-S-oxide reductase [Solirubrobacterales bacterium]|nr:peptide-methionine (S)-S-oxide reductase [Solirubrobacterales bacterium]